MTQRQLHRASMECARQEAFVRMANAALAAHQVAVHANKSSWATVCTIFNVPPVPHANVALAVEEVVSILTYTAF